MQSRLRQQFEDDGYIIINNFLNQETIKNLRTKLSEVKDEKKYLGFYSWSGYEQFVEDILTNKKLNQIKEIYDEPIFYPDFQLQISNSPKKLLRPHWDLQSFLKFNKMKTIKSIKYAKVGIYLQDSDVNISGSIHYVPNSHKSFFYSLKRPKRFLSYINTIRKKFLTKKQIVMKLKAGDMLIFNGKLLHSSSPKKGNIKKISFYMSLLGNKNSLKSYLSNEILRMSNDILTTDKNSDHRIEYIFSNEKIEKFKNSSIIPIFIIDHNSIIDLKKKLI